MTRNRQFVLVIIPANTFIAIVNLGRKAAQNLASISCGCQAKRHKLKIWQENSLCTANSTRSGYSLSQIFLSFLQNEIEGHIVAVCLLAKTVCLCVSMCVCLQNYRNCNEQWSQHRRTAIFLDAANVCAQAKQEKTYFRHVKGFFMDTWRFKKIFILFFQSQFCINNIIHRV